MIFWWFIVLDLGSSKMQTKFFFVNIGPHTGLKRVFGTKNFQKIRVPHYVDEISQTFFYSLSTLSNFHLKISKV